VPHFIENPAELILGKTVWRDPRWIPSRRSLPETRCGRPALGDCCREQAVEGLKESILRINFLIRVVLFTNFQGLVVPNVPFLLLQHLDLFISARKNARGRSLGVPLRWRSYIRPSSWD
jgi:hypothetical protein